MKKLKFAAALLFIVSIISCRQDDSDFKNENFQKKEAKESIPKNKTQYEERKEKDSIRIRPLDRDGASNSLETTDPDKIRPPKI